VGRGAQQRSGLATSTVRVGMVFFALHVACGAASHAAPPAATCTGGPTTVTESRSIDSISENVDGTCASVVGFVMWKMGATGSSCSDPSDCTPVCCPCPNGTHHSLATWCNHGTCAAGTDACCAILGTSGLASCS
jgi:hypothetical protein